MPVQTLSEMLEGSDSMSGYMVVELQAFTELQSGMITVSECVVQGGSWSRGRVLALCCWWCVALRAVACC